MTELKYLSKLLANVENIDSFSPLEVTTILRRASFAVELDLCDPYPPQWPTSHWITKSGGILPYDREYLMDKLREKIASCRP